MKKKHTGSYKKTYVWITEDSCGISTFGVSTPSSTVRLPLTGPIDIEHLTTALQQCLDARALSEIGENAL